MAKIFLWNKKYDTEPIPKELRDHVLDLEEDNPDGSSNLVCGFCGKIFRYVKEIVSCPHCGKDLIFPRCDW